MKKQKGFSLIELLIVVAIILIIAAIAIPNLLRSRMAANEASAVGSIRTLNTSAVTFSTTYQTQGYPPSMAAMGDGGTSPCSATVAQACLIDNTLASATTAATGKSGYYFTWKGDGNTPSVGYTVNGNPVTMQQSGSRGFFSDQSGVIRANPGAAASATSAPIQ